MPSKGGDTLFTNQYLAYETLSDGLKETLAGLRAISVGDRFKSAGGKTRKEMYAGRTSMQVKDPGNVQTTSSHPVVRTHPETGRKALYVGGHCQYFDGLTDAESEPLLDYLRSHSIKPEFQCRFRWEEGSVAFWVQPLHPALRARRLSRRDPDHAPRHHLRRHPGLTARYRSCP